jgi:hypothetical protein
MHPSSQAVPIFSSYSAHSWSYHKPPSPHSDMGHQPSQIPSQIHSQSNPGIKATQSYSEPVEENAPGPQLNVEYESSTGFEEADRLSPYPNSPFTGQVEQDPLAQRYSMSANSSQRLHAVPGAMHPGHLRGIGSGLTVPTLPRPECPMFYEEGHYDLQYQNNEPYNAWPSKPQLDRNMKYSEPDRYKGHGSPHSQQQSDSRQLHPYPLQTPLRDQESSIQDPWTRAVIGGGNQQIPVLKNAYRCSTRTSEGSIRGRNSSYGIGSPPTDGDEATPMSSLHTPLPETDASDWTQHPMSRTGDGVHFEMGKAPHLTNTSSTSYCETDIPNTLPGHDHHPMFGAYAGQSQPNHSKSNDGAYAM